jgi:ribulose 1,5-bisphosphate synthetase/thiazole synthase
MAETVAKVQVRIELLITVSDSWGTDCTVGQINKQATESAKRLLTRVLFDDLVLKGDRDRIAVIGVKVPSVTITGPDV